MVPARRILGLLSIAVALVIGVGASVAVTEADKPIIAELFADPAHYDGRAVTIYGLVIETEALGHRFLLQDVSQMPLPVERADGKLTLVGDQLLIEGKFHANGGKPYLRATAITPTKVLGGGGCC